MQEPSSAPRGEIAATISREAVQILREYTGRGPTKARTTINTELVAITFSDTLTKGEAKLVALGKGDHVLQTRREYQRAMREDLVGTVESNTGRKVIAFLSDNHLDPDFGLEAFIMEREDGAHETVSAAIDTASDSDA
jgi:uncharacterized protein YbcI